MYTNLVMDVCNVCNYLLGNIVQLYTKNKYGTIGNSMINKLQDIMNSSKIDNWSW